MSESQEMGSAQPEGAVSGDRVVVLKRQAVPLLRNRPMVEVRTDF